MKFRFVIAACCALAVFLLGACSQQEEPREESVLSSQSRPAESSEAFSSREEERESVSVQDSREETPSPAGKLFVQQNSSAEEGYEPTIRLLEDGSFEFSAYCYDGVVVLEGTYRQEGEDYCFTPKTSTAPEGAVGSSLSEFWLVLGEEGMTYTGEDLGVTFEGALFRETAE